MKRNAIICGAAAIAILTGSVLSSPADAQSYISTPVEISKEKVRVDGKVCYSHIVLEKQTLFSISKAYGVSIDDIYRFNPTLKENGLKKNSIIIIPSQETLAEINVPETSAKKEKKEQTQKSRRIHIAKWYEDLDVIAEQYGVTADAIMKANNLKGRKLSRRQKLVIPYPGEEIATVQEEQVSFPEETVAATEEMAETDSTAAILHKEPIPEAVPKTSVSATLILPLTAADGEPSRNNTDFYCGALLAIYDMSSEGLDCTLNVYDIMDSGTQMDIESIEESDVVIGPVSAADLTKLFNIAHNADAVVSPLDPRAERLAGEHQEMIQAPAPHHVLYSDIVRWMEEDFKAGDRVVLITEKGARQSGVTSQMKTELDSSSLAYTPFSYSILEGRDITKPLTALMTTEGANRVLVASENEAFVNDVVRNLNLLIYNNIDIVLYAPSKIRNFNTIEVENLHNAALHVSLGYYTDYDSPQVRDFLLKYRALYNTEPTQFAFQGYDITKYFLTLIAKYGENWRGMLEDAPQEMLQSTFDFTRLSSGGFINSGTRRIVYDSGYRVTKVR